MSDEFEEAEYEEEDFQEAPEVNTLTKYEEIVFCPDCDVYMPYKVDGAIVRRKCPNCGKEFEGGREVAPSAPQRASGKPPVRAPSPGAAPAVPKKATPTPIPAEEQRATCAATTRSGTPCNNPPRAGSKYCSSHRGWRPPRK